MPIFHFQSIMLPFLNERAKIIVTINFLGHFFAIRLNSGSFLLANIIGKWLMKKSQKGARFLSVKFVTILRVRLVIGIDTSQRISING